MPASTQTVDKIIFSKSILIPSSPALAGFFVSPHLYLHSSVRIRFILVVTILFITNFVVWSWALEKHPKFQPVSMEFV